MIEKSSESTQLFTPSTEGARRALAVGGGGTCGSTIAGILYTFGKELGPDFFDAVYACSVGVYPSTFYIANQPTTINNTWRELVDGTKLVNPFNILIGRPVLKLEYLTRIFKSGISWLDTKAVLNGVTPNLCSYRSGNRKSSLQKTPNQ